MSDNSDIAVALLQFDAQLQAALNGREVAFTAVNESFAVLKFDQAVIWKHDLFNYPIITAASGLADVTLDSPYVQWLGRAIKSFPDGEGNVRPVKLSELPEAIVAEGSEWCSEHLLSCTLKGPDGFSRGGLLFSRAEPFTEADISVAEWLARATGYALWAWRGNRRHMWRRLGGRKAGMVIAALLLVCAALGMIPVQLLSLIHI